MRLSRAKFKCLDCGAVFSFKVAPDQGTDCIKCGYVYVKWLNSYLFIKATLKEIEDDTY